jgi:hypothetical protein
MQTPNMLEQPRIQRYSPIGSENVFGAVNQQARQSQKDCQAPETTKGHLHREMVV